MSTKNIFYALLAICIVLSLMSGVYYSVTFLKNKSKENRTTQQSKSITRITAHNETQPSQKNPKAVSPPNNPPQESPVTILAFGDVMLDRYVGNAIRNNSLEYPFEKIKDFLKGNDLVLTNLEGSFTDFQPKALQPNNLSFTFDPALVPILKNLGFATFNLANNHALNFGNTGFKQSQEYLKKNNLQYFGHPLNNENISLIQEVRGSKIGFVGYHELINLNFDKVLEEIKLIKPRVDLVIVYTHWGLEYKTNFSSAQQKQAHQIIDAGADVILGSHPHVIQPIEIYNNKIIFYSFGNFIFDQTFSQKTQEGLGVKIVFDKSTSTLEYYLFPTQIKNLQVHLPDKTKHDNMVLELANNSPVSEAVKQEIISGKITVPYESTR